MSDEIIVKTTAEPASLQPTTIEGDLTITFNRSLLINIFAVLLIASFFLSWTQVFGTNLSGFDLHKIGRHKNYIHWILPLCAALTIAAPYLGFKQKVVAQISGALPFLILLYWLNRLGTDLVKTLSFGAALALLSGIALLIIPNLKK